MRFTIDLLPGINLYWRLVHDELRELEIQLRELVDKSFIQPSTTLLRSPSLLVRKKMDLETVH